VAVLLLGLAAGARAGDPSSLVIDAAAGPVTITVEIADTAQSRAVGLMFRRDLGLRQGMLFDFQAPQPVSFWMRNTLIPLDMLFIDSGGRIVRIHANAEPLSEVPIPSGEPVLAVLEIAGGEAARLGIAVGDQAHHPIFER
jgi:uncharacterized membrane protein (UPF0127 family)